MAKTSEKSLEGITLTIAERALLLRVRKRFEEGVKAEHHNRTAAKEDLKFCNNEDHWDPQIERQRAIDGRPSLVFNHLVPFIRDVIGDQRESRPDSKVSPVGTSADRMGAKIREGYLRNRKHECNADHAYDIAFGQALRGGFGYLRVLTKYESDDSFDQTFVITEVFNQFSVTWDPNAQQWDRNDGEWMAVFSHIPRETFERKYPNITPSSFDTSSTAWYPSKDKFTVVEYFEKEHNQEPLYQLSTGEVVRKEQIPDGVDKRVGNSWPNPAFNPQAPDPATPPEIKIIKRRFIDEVKINRYLLCGHAILEKAVEWPSSYWSIIPVDGDEMGIEGKRHLRSLIRFSKDPQRALNMSRSSEIEVIALAPKAPVTGTPQMFENYEEIWDNLHHKTYSRAPYNPDPLMPGVMPTRLSGIDPNYVAAIAQSTQQAKEEIRQTIGPNIILPKMPSSHQEISGLALGKWQSEGDISTYMFVDNLTRAIQQADQVCVDLMGKILDTNRVITIRKIDGTVENVEINKVELNQQTGQQVVVNDMTKGEYAVETVPGPSYATQRAEQAEAMIKFATAAGPQLVTGTADILASMLFQAQGGQVGQGGGLEDFVHRVKKILIKSGQLDITDLKQDEIRDFLPILMKPKQINPLMLARLKKEMAQAMKAVADAEEKLAKAGQIDIETQERFGQVVSNLMKIAMEQPGQQPGAPGAEPMTNVASPPTGPMVGPQ